MLHVYIWGFIFGTFKFMFAHWLVFGLAEQLGHSTSFFDLFIPPTAGAIATMAVFYFSSDYLMERAAKKRRLRYEQALASGTPYTQKKRFTWVNKFLVRIKRTVGISGIAFLAPLFLSIPIGSIVCAKFYGNKPQTFPLMVIFMSIYSLIMSVAILIIKS